MKQEFYSNGKLLLTGEYAVLDGATALALPTKYGQSLEAEEASGNFIKWTSYDSDGSIWFDEELPISDVLYRVQNSDKPETNTLIRILHEASLLNRGFLKQGSGFKVITKLTFPRKWGLGTSSTLINNIADWFLIDAFTLLKNSFGGSGYDIACAQNDTAVLYSLANGNPNVSQVAFEPAFANTMYFVYLNTKQNSREAIEGYRKRGNDVQSIIAQINAVTQAALIARDIDTFASAMEQHEQIMSDVLGMKAVKERLFPDFPGTLKSLGAWGGDFILAVSRDDPSAYFRGRGYETIAPYNEMILNKKS